ncbi:ABC transporter substrate-binding protein [Ramlibacter sp. 2FC]|uniref:ABC transporter substrate-binding protein n=1 Tax=Ramlibacter sp. 2FC TaxID=2502188 RepID=UPI0014858C35|nr:ABC transporter substrate-binding protein [Ramlibacter sp. 2FC]
MKASISPTAARAPQQGAPRRRLCASLAQLTAGAMLGGFALAASAFESPADGVYKDRIDWGLMMDMSGTASASQIPWVNGVKAYINKVNEAGGINGRKINLLVEDDRYDASISRTNYEKLNNQTPALGVSGLGNSSAQAALMTGIRRGKLPIVGAYAITKAGLEPATPTYYAGFCGNKEMAQVGVNAFTDKMNLKAPKVVTAHMDVAGGKDFADYVAAEVAKRGGTHKALPIKVGAADVTAQVLEINAMKPDFIAVYGVPSPTILLMKTMHQYALKIPTFSITHLGTPEIYGSIGAEAGASYSFVSCFSPADVADSAGVREMSAAADKGGFGAMKNNVNFVGGWVVGQLIVEVVSKAGKEPTRDKLMDVLSKTVEIDTKGVTGPIRYTPEDHRGPVVMRPYNYDYKTGKFVAQGNFADYAKYVK